MKNIAFLLIVLMSCEYGSKGDQQVEKNKNRGVVYSTNLELKNPCFTIYNFENQPDSILLLRKSHVIETFFDVKNSNGTLNFQYNNIITDYKNYEIQLFIKKNVISIKLQKFELNRLVNGGCGAMSDAFFDLDIKKFR